ncbi:MAG: hypothetical protein ACYCV7_17175, partial [Acidimicrobiales bacterium]
MIADPPLLDGGLQASEICMVPPVALSDVGEPGAVAGAADDTPNTVPVNWARSGLLEELSVADTHAGGPAVWVGVGETGSQAPDP